ncbi:serine/threonine protein kinase [Mesoplasma lactucae]|uniref:Uncharacterized protein n=1 Tax=Mesoplasma lactucae ATCC 49193 TaxID=81460 RepID=A0A291IRW2_9MOLU|nr:serine/threonine-protein kinase [Mesoplasma lactucae]ATG97539.1 hypothetical protein CP520_02110 [Mesoplasma lactucae ATCC 49193]ATZ20003.1 serine/threonine protein kinase [Mesoplasma lactucae ATCC 49193]MCL8217046.1 Serine/threonine-protein kinase PrkC [Mesoplasma lactucae ATCC 49193]
MAIKKNSVIDNRYVVIEEVGKGASSVVYKVYDKTNKHTKALKLLKNKVNAGFKKEIEILSTLSFENYVTPIDNFGVAMIDGEEHPYMVLDYYDNDTISKVASSKDYPIFTTREIEYYFSRVLSGLKRIHYNDFSNMIHKDIKPQNILLNSAWDPYIADFGITQILEKDNFELEASGTPKYMAPELFVEKNAKDYETDAKDMPYYIDIYALGVMLYTYSTGIVPFENFNVLTTTNSKNGKQIASRDLNLWMDTIKPSVYNPEINPRLENIILKAMAKDYTKRYQNVDQMQIDLSRLYDDKNIKMFEDYNVRPRNSKKFLNTYVTRFQTFLNTFNWKWIVGISVITILLIVGFVLTILLV